MSTNNPAPDGWRHRLVSLTLAGAVAAMAVGAISLIHSAHAQRQAVHEDALAPIRLPVPAASLALEDGYALTRHYTGTVTARREVDLAFQVSGRVDGIAAEVGDRVAQGQALAHLDTRRLDAELARLAGSEREAQAQATLAEANARRQQSLRQQGLAAREAVDRTRADADVAAARLDALAAQQQALAVDLADSVLRAPFDAVVVERGVEAGRFAQPSLVAYRLLALDEPEARVGLPVEAARGLAPGDRVEVRWRDETLAGRIRALVPQVGVQTRTLTALITLEAGQRHLAAGDTVELDLSRHVAQAGFWVPNTALVAAPRGLWAVYRLTPAEPGVDTVEPAVVEVLHSAAERSFVRGTLSAGDRVVMAGTHRISPGQRVAAVVVVDRAVAAR